MTARSLNELARSVAASAKRAIGSTRRRFQRRWMLRRFPTDGFAPTQLDQNTPLDRLDDESLAVVNQLLPWQCFTTDVLGRRLGAPAWSGKRTKPQSIPDRRIVELDTRFDLCNKSVLEVGCFEGVHTLGLLQYTSSVTAVDARIENVLKTSARCALYGYHPAVLQCNVESPDARRENLSADVVHHVGVLYHLLDPVTHLLDVGRWARRGLMLDTHYAVSTDDFYIVDGERFEVRRYAEHGRDEVFSGVHAIARWLPLPTIIDLLERGGLDRVEVAEDRAERNGRRVLLFAERSSAPEQPQIPGH